MCGGGVSGGLGEGGRGLGGGLGLGGDGGLGLGGGGLGDGDGGGRGGGNMVDASIVAVTMAALSSLEYMEATVFEQTVEKASRCFPFGQATRDCTALCKRVIGTPPCIRSMYRIMSWTYQRGGRADFVGATGHIPRGRGRRSQSDQRVRACGGCGDEGGAA